MKLGSLDICIPHVLIDTWWNVNVDFQRIILHPRLVLIDTWWNVNFVYIPYKVVNTAVLIDTWWNVNNSRGVSNSSANSF